MRYVKTKDRVVWEEYRLLRNTIKIIIRAARNLYFTSTLGNNMSSKDMWKF